ncbi:MAG: membrane dipeptidase [Myxococcota bacterium]
MNRIAKIGGLFALGVSLVLGFALALAPGIADGLFNRVLAADLPEPSAAAVGTHARAFIVDLHADPLLWKRDLTVRNTRGHIDFPRLREGGVNLQVFSAVTKSPKNQNYRRTSGDTDALTKLFIGSLAPIETWSDLEARAHYQAAKLEAFVEQTNSVLVLQASDLERLQSSAEQRAPIGALLAVEGIHCLQGDLSAIDRLYESGYRMFGLAHFFDNEFSGSAHGVEKYGLTALGKKALQRFEELEVIVDLAHSSEQAFDDVMARATRPIVVSHTGVRGTCESPRNLTDRQLEALRKNGGLVGIGYWKGAVCGVLPSDFAKAARYTADRIGVEHVALGSDFDGAVTTAFDASRLVVVTHALLEAGFSESETLDILGGNARRFLERWLPKLPKLPKSTW